MENRELGFSEYNMLAANSTDSTSEMKSFELFREYDFAESQIKDLLLQFEKENNSPSVAEATPDQVERLKDLIVELETQSNSIIGKLPKKFLRDNYLDFTAEQLNEIKKAIQDACDRDSIDDIRALDDAQQLELKMMIEQYIVDNIQKKLEKKSRIQEVTDMDAYYKEKEKVAAMISDIQKEFVEQKKKFDLATDQILEQINNLKKNMKNKSAKNLVEFQNMQIASLVAEQRIAKDKIKLLTKENESLQTIKNKTELLAGELEELKETRNQMNLLAKENEELRMSKNKMDFLAKENEELRMSKNKMDFLAKENEELRMRLEIFSSVLDMNSQKLADLTKSVNRSDSNSKHNPILN